MKETRKTRTVRELGGEIYGVLDAERTKLISQGDNSLINLDWKTLAKATDVIMSVIVRHVGEIIENDLDLPVDPQPLPKE